MEKDEREKVSKIEDLWIDIGATTRAEAEAHVRMGDAGVLAAGPLELPNGRLVSRSLDNRVGAFVVLEALRLLKAGGALARPPSPRWPRRGRRSPTPAAAPAPRRPTSRPWRPSSWT